MNGSIAQVEQAGVYSEGHWVIEPYTYREAEAATAGASGITLSLDKEAEAFAECATTCNCSLGYKTSLDLGEVEVANLTISHLTAGNSIYLPGITGACTKLNWGLLPVYFEIDGLALTESGHDGAGNPINKNGTLIPESDPPGYYPGWYSGTPNGNGAPLAGYETPQGTGVALGRYFE